MSLWSSLFVLLITTSTDRPIVLTALAWPHIVTEDHQHLSASMKWHMEDSPPLSLSLSRQTLINERKQDTHGLHLRIVWRFLMTHCCHLHPWLSALSGKTLHWMSELFHTSHMHTHKTYLAARSLRILQRIHYPGVPQTQNQFTRYTFESVLIFPSNRHKWINKWRSHTVQLKCDDVTVNLNIGCTAWIYCVA